MTLKLRSITPLVALALGACELSTKNLGDPNAESASDGATAGGTEGQTSQTATGPEPATGGGPSAGPTEATSGGTDPGESSESGEPGTSTGPAKLDVGGGELCEDPLHAPGVSKQCTIDEDCVVVFHQVDCCGSVEAYGIDDDSLDAYNEAEAPCMFEPICDCIPMPTPTEDGMTTTDNGSIVAVCVDNQCQSQAPAAGPLNWYTTCGDPVCSGYVEPEGVEPCTPAQLEGGPCDVDGATCDPMSECNALLVCAAADPKQEQPGCPISRARFKTDIEYLAPADLARHAEELASLKLATYRYRSAPADSPPRLGIILEDNEAGVWVDARHDRVDLYGYASLAVAALQVQQQQIAALQAEVERLSAQLVSPMCGP